MWVFGYGSLIWRPGFPFEERRVGRVRGYIRRFWQASPDHRGTPESPGRVVTLLPDPEGTVVGAVYRLGDAGRQQVLRALDLREVAGYERVDLPVATEAGPVTATTWIATADNPSFAGPAAVSEIAAVIRTASGASGANREYVERLLDALGDDADDHLRAVWNAVRAMPHG